MKPYPSFVALTVLPALLALGCGDDLSPRVAPPGDAPPASAQAALVSTNNAELMDYKRECANASFGCAPLVAGGSDCACDVPQTGTAPSGFEEVDIAMRQMLAFHDIGAGALAIRYKGRLVYKRGFGHLDGDWDAPGGALVPADSPLKIGSISKNIVAAVMRDVVDQKLQVTGWKWLYPTAGDVPLLFDFDPATPGCGPADHDCLLPESVHALFDGRADLPVVFDDLDPDPEELAADDYPCARYAPGRADASWSDTTVGDILGHSAGLPRSVVDEKFIYAAIPAFRGYDSRADFEAELASVKDAHPGWVGDIEASRQVVAAALGVDSDDLFYLNRFDALGGGDASDEVLQAIAGRCLLAAPATNTDSQPSSGPTTGYSNGLGSFAERIVTHLHPSGRFAAPSGYPSLHAGSALESFLADELALFHGVESREGVFAAQNQLERDDIEDGWAIANVVPRVWNSSASSWYASVANSRKRPFCVYDDASDSCDFDGWSAADGALRSPWNFALDGGAVAKVPEWKSGWDLNTGPGGLMAEMPILAMLADRFVIDGSLHKGRRIADCPNCPSINSHNGSLGGAYAQVVRLGSTFGGSELLPPLDPRGRMTNVISEPLLQTRAISLPAGVTFAFAINQSDDPACAALNVPSDLGDLVPEGGAAPASCDIYHQLVNQVKYALSRVDWLRVDEHVAAEARRVQGMTMADTSEAGYAMADDALWMREGGPQVHRDAQDGVRVAMDLPSSRVGTHIVAAASDDNGYLFTFYDDGRVSVAYSPAVHYGVADELADGDGATHDDRVVALDELSDPVSYAIAPDKLVRDILDVGITNGPDGQVAVTYYRDGTYSVGDVLDLAADGVAAYTVPPGQIRADIVGVALVGGDASHVWTRYRDGSVSYGALSDLDSGGYWRGSVDDIAMNAAGDTALIYHTGFVRWIAGTLADNWPIKDAVAIGWDWLTTHPAASPGATVTGVGLASQDAWVLTSDGTFSRHRGDLAWRSPFAHGVNTTAFEPVMNAPKPWTDVVGLAGAETLTWSWWKDGTVTQGSGNTMDLEGFVPFQAAPFQSPSTIAGIATTPVDGGLVWTLYKDGSVSAGSAVDLDRKLYLKAPPVLMAP